MANDTIKKTLVVAVLLCVVCSVMVSTAAVKLKPLQVKNKELYTKQNILAAAGLMEEGKSVDELFGKIQVKIVDLSTGEYDETFDDPSKYDQRTAAKDASLSVEIPADKDLGRIKRRAKKAAVYLVKEDGQLQTIILPMHGKALWSTMYAFLALDRDGNTVKGYSFYEHGETPGLGGEVDNTLWKSQWVGKKVFDGNWNLVIDILKGKVDSSKPEAIHQADGLSGATLTTVGVENLMLYWLGEHGFRKFLTRIRKQGVENG
ncbi:MAG: Na(+)-translocating NADH-quinone reductase subunit C [Proteobacteria bacterium]|nr:Na(+)-translocating NADH-quinone reductase subunit C [Pseudomonadota bacterium]